MARPGTPSWPQSIPTIPFGSADAPEGEHLYREADAAQRSAASAMRQVHTSLQSCVKISLTAGGAQQTVETGRMAAPQEPCPLGGSLWASSDFSGSGRERITWEQGRRCRRRRSGNSRITWGAGLAGTGSDADCPGRGARKSGAPPVRIVPPAPEASAGKGVPLPRKVHCHFVQPPV